MPRTVKKETESSPLVLLRQIRDVMASPASAQDRLDAIVRVIASEMACDVCSVYLLRAGDVLELFANVGLNPSSVHLTRLQVGEGLVGDIAATAIPVNLADAQHHPKFVYRPETGEEMYNAFVGVPILQSGKVVGVLVVQDKQEKNFSDDQIEVLQTVAMVLAELNQSGKLVSKSELREGSSTTLFSQHFVGLKFAPGLARGVAVLHRKRIEVKIALSEDPAREYQRLQAALDSLQDSIDKLIYQAGLEEGGEHRDIMEAYRMFAHDKGWISRIAEAINGGLTAESAVVKAQEEMTERMNLVSSEYIRDRIHDLEDVSNRLLQHLSGENRIQGPQHLPARFILVARTLGPAELLEYGRKRLKGIILEDGAATSHIVIIARAMEIPVVGKVAGAYGLIQSGDPVIVDGDNGEVYLRPNDSIERTVSEHIRSNEMRTQAYAAQQNLLPISQDGVKVSLNINAGLFVDVKHLQADDVDGIGLYRTELPYLISPSMPDVKSQARVYSKILRQAGDKKVIFRTFDIGGDKQLPYFPIDGEENPALGWRATRIGLDRPAILRRQFRALIHAAADRQLNVMLPFITQVNEIDEARKLIDLELARAQSDGITLPRKIRVGTMIEVPAILWQLPALMKRVDFISIGSNDLLQFIFACDRGSQRVSDRYDTLAPEVLLIVRNILEECNKAGVEAGFCGEMASKPLEAMALIGVGLRAFSMPPSAVGPVKTMVRSLDVAELTKYIDMLCASSEPSIRRMLEEYARDHQITI
ncbi:MAG TPA: phosphoenolpyruvate--protein phosphotransferase [Rickettsiales bacterium]|nr:phosphoenolpyruvate--protein phosphotransferase [Rickettsiales bacterium]